jgi:outer membrane protein OmpA-like peptidoglycan-associated protein
MKSLCLLFLPFLVGTVCAQSDVEGSADHPLFTRLPNFIIYSYEQKEYDVASFIVPVKDGEYKKIEQEGKRTVIGYRSKEGLKPEPSIVQVTRNYVNAAKKIGGTIVFDGKGKDWFYEGGLYTVHDVTMKFAKNDGEVWASIMFDGSYLPPDVAFFLTIIEKQEMRQDVMASSEMLSALNALGKVTLYINFDTGKWNIKDESLPVISEIEKLMKENASLKLSIEGHTDNVGDPKSNQKLSESRAKAVVDELVKRGVPKARLQSKGFGQSKPIEDNTTEEGRAKNRRVELVKIP